MEAGPHHLAGLGADAMSSAGEDLAASNNSMEIGVGPLAAAGLAPTPRSTLRAVPGGTEHRGRTNAEPAPLLIPGADGLDLALHDFGGRGPTLLMAHATGMHGWVFRSLARHLTPRFRCWAVDLRGHGGSVAAAEETFDWGGFARDVGAAAEYLADVCGGPVVGFGHSLGGAAMILAAGRAPQAFAELVLYEAAVLPPGRSAQTGFEQQLNQMVAGAQRRRPSFPSDAEATYNYAGKIPTRSLEAGVLHDYVRHGFAPDQNGRVELRCLPSVEATTYAQTHTQERYGLWSALGDLSCPVQWLVGSDTDAEQVRTSREVAEQLAVPVTVLAGLDHFGPLQLPALVAHEIRTARR